MIKKLPCLYGFIASTEKGNRNKNLFHAINHLRHYNQTATMDDILTEALQINKSFSSPLSKNEVTIVCQHVLNKKYHTSCWHFKRYCRHCKYGKFHKSFKDSNPKYWKHINKNNKLINIKTIPDDTYYPWDIIDTSKLHDIEINGDNGKEILTKETQIARVQQLREQKGIPIAIDIIVKSYGIPIGYDAKKKWNDFRESD